MINKRFFNEIFVQEIYAPAKTLGHMSTVLDVGATTGEFSLWIQHMADVIYAIEGNKELLSHLIENVFDFPHIIPFNIAIGNENRMGHMTGSSDGHPHGLMNGGSRLSHDATPTPYDIPVYTLATLMKECNMRTIDVLKIDIEDGEKEVFEASDFKDVAPYIKMIIGEHVSHSSGITLKELGFTEIQKGAYYIRQ